MPLLQMGGSLSLFLALICTHFVTDFGLQSGAMAAGKAGQLDASPDAPSQLDWLLAHVIINAAGVLLVTGSPLAAGVEFVIHFCIDRCKIAGLLTYRQDQGLHIICKMIIALIMI